MNLASEISPHEKFVRLGPFLIDVSSGEVQKDGQRVRIPDQPTRLLLALLEKPGEIITREELRTKLWPDDTNVEFSHSIHAAINKLRHALGDSHEQPRFIETIPRRGYRLVLQTSATIQPGVSTATCAGIGQSAPAASPAAVPLWRRRPELLLGATLLLTLATLTIATLHIKSRTKSPTTASAPSLSQSSLPRRVAIVGFKDLSSRNDSAWLSTAVAEMLSTELGASAALQPVSGEDVAQMKRELLIAEADSYAQPTLRRIQQNSGAELVVAGSLMRIGSGSPKDRVRFDIHLQNPNTGQTLASLSETGTMAQLFDLVSDAGLQLRKQLGVAPLSSSEEAEIRHAVPANSEAQRLYFSGLEKLREFDYLGARQILLQAVDADPKDSLAHEALSAAYSARGFDTLAAEQAKLAFDLTKGLTYEQGLQIEGRYYETKHEWARAEETYRRLASLSPQTIDFSLRLAHVQGLSGKPSEALATLDHWRALSHSAKDSARIDLAEASLEQKSGDSKKELAAAQAAAAQGEQAHAPMVIAEALRSQGVALGYLGDSVQALDKEHAAERIFETLNDPGGLVDALIEEGDILSDHGDASAAAAAWHRALVLARSISSIQKEAIISNNLGNLLLMQGEPAKARESFQHSYEVFREVDDKIGQANSLLIIGDALQDEGRLSEAKIYYQKASKLALEIGHKAVRAAALQGLAGALLDQGDLAQAKESAEESVTVARASGDKATETAALIFLGQVVAAQGSLTDGQSIEQKALSDADALAAKSLQAWAHVALGHILLMRGNAAAARAHSEQALSLEQSIGAGTEERETRYILADLAIEERRISDARQMLQELCNALEHRPNVDAELECLILQTKVALLEKQGAAALKTALRARAVSTHSERLELQLSATEVLALAAGASRQWAQADRVINSALGKASQSGCVACEFKVQYSQCDLSEKRDASRGALCFAELNKRAAARGFGLIARNAATETAILAK